MPKTKTTRTKPTVKQTVMKMLERLTAALEKPDPEPVAVVPGTEEEEGKKAEVKADRKSAAVAWVFTLNNYTPEEVKDIQKGKWWKYMIFGYEIGPETGTPHLQGYLLLKNRQRLDTARMLIPRGAWFARNGTHQEARDYCIYGDYDEAKAESRKPIVLNKIWTGGKEPASGERNDLDQVRAQALDEGMRGVVTTRNFQQIRVAEKWLSYCEPKRNFRPNVVWIYGPTGIGKSDLAHKMAEELSGDDVHVKNDADKWWDGYDAHETVIMDDFRDSWWPLTETLSLLDKFAKPVPNKGGFRQMRSKNMIITCPFHPSQMYLGTGEEMMQLVRRTTTIIRFPEMTEEKGWDLFQEWSAQQKKVAERKATRKAKAKHQAAHGPIAQPILMNSIFSMP